VNIVFNILNCFFFCSKYNFEFYTFLNNILFKTPFKLYNTQAICFIQNITLNRKKQFKTKITQTLHITVNRLTKRSILLKKMQYSRHGFSKVDTLDRYILFLESITI